jgi:hypothetical protein
VERSSRDPSTFICRQTQLFIPSDHRTTKHLVTTHHVSSMANRPPPTAWNAYVRMRRHERRRLLMVRTALALLVPSHLPHITIVPNSLTRYIADYVFALPTVAFFLCTIGIFILGHAVSSISGYKRWRGSVLWRKSVAAIRYLAYRGFHVKALAWNSAPMGVLLLGAIGTIFFFCKTLATTLGGSVELTYL